MSLSPSITGMLMSVRTMSKWPCDELLEALGAVLGLDADDVLDALQRVHDAAAHRLRVVHDQRPDLLHGRRR